MKEHCATRLSFYASFVREQRTGSTAQCRVCRRWVGYFWLGPDRYDEAEGGTFEEVVAALGGEVR